MGSYTGTVPTFLSGELPDSDKFDEITNFMTAATAAWTSAAPTWTASAGTPAIGNGTLVGRYRRLGKTVNFQIHLTWGSTTTGGTAGAVWFFTIPGGGTAAETYTGTGWVYDTSAGSNYMVTWKIDGTATTMRIWRDDASPSVELVNNFFAFATGDNVVLNGTLEIQ